MRIGRHIVEFEQGGEEKAEYGAGLIQRLAKDLRLRHGKGFDRSNLIRMRLFYLAYPKGATLSDYCRTSLKQQTIFWFLKLTNLIALNRPASGSAT